MKTKITTVTVGIAAYNEEGSIRRLIQSLLNQHIKNIKLECIHVISDGSSDGTVREAKRVHDNRVHITDDGKRKGPSVRHQEIFASCNSDVLVMIDADMVVKSRSTLAAIVTPFLENPDLDLVTGEILPLEARTFIESAVNNYRIARYKLRHAFEWGKTGYSAHGFYAVSRKFAHSITIIRGIMAFDAYCFLYAMKHQKVCFFSQNAIVYYRSPQTVADVANQFLRHHRGGVQLESVFGSEFVRSKFKVPALINLQLLTYQLLRNPLGYFAIKLIFIYSKLKARYDHHAFNAIWVSPLTTKLRHR